MRRIAVLDIDIHADPKRDPELRRVPTGESADSRSRLRVSGERTSRPRSPR
jgi:hypothetical protein